MGRYFGTNGVRGVFGSGFTLEVAHRMAMAFGTHLGRGPVLVGHDVRASSQAVARAVTSGLCSIGTDCATAGLVPTPCLELAVKRLGYAGGIMVTASHNPPEYNGIKPVAPDGVEISRADEAAVEEIYDSGKWRTGAGWGSVQKEDRAVDAYLGAVVSMVDAGLIRKAGLRVALDIGNGAQAVAAPKLCRMLGCDPIVVNGDVDGRFPGRGPEPTPDNIGALVEAARGADLGVAFDGDGDRSVFCDGDGAALTGDRSALVLARHILRKNPESEIVTCINSGSAIDVIAAESGSRVERTKVGSVEVSRRMVSGGSLLGFEENGGFMYGPHNQVRDGCMALALMLDMVASGTSLADAASELPASHTAKEKVRCDTKAIPGIMESLAAMHPGSDTGDGIRIVHGPNNWVMVRPSGTEPIVRIYAEAASEEALETAMSEHVTLVRRLAGA